MLQAAREAVRVNNQYGVTAWMDAAANAGSEDSLFDFKAGPDSVGVLPLYHINAFAVTMLAPLALTGSAAYVQLALAVTLLVGLMQWLIGALRLGALDDGAIAGGAAGHAHPSAHDFDGLAGGWSDLCPRARIQWSFWSRSVF